MARAKSHRLRAVLPLGTVKRRVISLLRTPFFWIITIWGNAWVAIGAIALHYFESGLNPSVHDWLDCISWSVGMVTTVGGGGINLMTLGGKVVSIAMMMGGALFLWSYMALFVGAFVDPELKGIEREVTELQHDREEGERLLLRLRVLTEELERHLAQASRVKEKVK